MDFKTHLTTAWDLFWENIAPLIVMTLVLIVLGSITFGILLPVLMAGYLQSILMLIREGKKPTVGDVFSEFRLFLPLFLFGVAACVLLIVGFSLLVVPGLVLLVAMLYFLLFMLPLMTDRGMGIFEAIKKSYHMMTTGSMADNVALALIYYALISLGGSWVLGMLITQPFAALFLLAAYEQRLKDEPIPEPEANPAPPQTETVITPPPPPMDEEYDE